MRKPLRIISWFLLWISFPVVAGEINIVSSVKPVSLIVEELLAPIEEMSTQVLVPKNASPHGFTLKPSQLQALLGASLVVWLGEEFEPYLHKAIEKRGAQPVLDLAHLPGIELLAARKTEQSHHKEAHVEEEADAEDAHGHAHHHGEFDPHLWWSSKNAVVIATAITAQLSQQYPSYQQALEQSLKSFSQRVKDNSKRIVQKDPATDSTFVVYHDSLAYLERELGYSSVRRVAVSPEAKPSLQDMLALSQLLSQPRVKCIILEPGANQSFLRKINGEQKARQLVIDPLGWDATSYSDMWLKAAEKLQGCGAP